MRFALACSLLALGQDLPRRGTFGVPLLPVPPDVATKLSLKPQSAAQFTAPATGKLAGDIKNGDILVDINGKSFSTFGEMNELIRQLPVGSNAKLTVLADGVRTERQVTITEKPRDKGENYEVIYDSVVSNGNRIRTFVSKPKAEGKRPVMFWIQGISASSVDSPLTSQNIVSKVLKSFSDDGWVTVRVEKTGVGDSEGGPALKVGFDEEADIYRQTLKTLDKYPFVDRSRVYIFGHSMGGCHAPIVASETPVKGIITYGTVSDSWLEWQIKAARWQSLLGGADPEEVDKLVRQTVTLYNALYTEKKSIPEIRKQYPDLAELIKQSAPTDEMLSVRSVKYMREVNDVNFGHYWQRVGDARVLDLFGENDFVSLEADQAQIPGFVNRKKAGAAVFMKVKESDHGFSKTTSMQDSMAKTGRPGAEFNPEVIRVLKEWIASVEKG
ncbi:MAG: alpha/beta fold hydrolase [Fimbriimonas sp.]